MTREQVLHQCYGAKTLAEVERAIGARDGWLRDHPGDDEVFHVGEMLSKLRQGLQPTSALTHPSGQKVPLP